MENDIPVLEIASVILNIAYVILAARENIWCWLFGILGSAASIWLFVNAKLYAESGLFLFYVVMGVYGWISWARSNSSSSNGSLELVIKVWPLKTHAVTIAAGTALTIGLGYILQTYSDSENPFLDSFTTVFGIITTWMVAEKLLENWLYWIVLNALSIYLYTSRGLNLYAILALVYTGMSIYGYINWFKDYRKQKSLQYE